MAIFNGYVSLPEGHQEHNWDNHDVIDSWDNHGIDGRKW
jgi:hypothetical protein